MSDDVFIDINNYIKTIGLDHIYSSLLIESRDNKYKDFEKKEFEVYFHHKMGYQYVKVKGKATYRNNRLSFDELKFDYFDKPPKGYLQNASE